jgi:8-oxo-dGTP diphosphatase
MPTPPAERASPDPPWTAINSAGYPAPAALAVDVVVLTVRARDLLVLVVDRGRRRLALPGGFVGRGESPKETAEAKLREKTGLVDLHLEQLETFGKPDRDPRGWLPTVAHLALVPPSTEPTDPAACWVAVRDPPKLEFDHKDILKAGVERVRGKLWWSNVAVGVLPGDFTLSQARQVYEALADMEYNAATFSRDLRSTDLIVPAGGRMVATRGRPATLYRFAQHEPNWGAGRRKRVAV